MLLAISRELKNSGETGLARFDVRGQKYRLADQYKRDPFDGRLQPNLIHRNRLNIGPFLRRASRSTARNAVLNFPPNQQGPAARPRYLLPGFAMSLTLLFVLSNVPGKLRRGRLSGGKVVPVNHITKYDCSVA